MKEFEVYDCLLNNIYLPQTEAALHIQHGCDLSGRKKIKIPEHTDYHIEIYSDFCEIKERIKVEKRRKKWMYFFNKKEEKSYSFKTVRKFIDLKVETLVFNSKRYILSIKKADDVE